MSAHYLEEARRGLPRIAQRLSILPVALTAFARLKPEYSPVIDHYLLLRKFSEIQDAVTNYLLPESQPIASPHWFLGMTHMRHGLSVGVSYDKAEKALTFIRAHAKKDLQEIMDEDVDRAARSVGQNSFQENLRTLQSSADKPSVIRLVEKEDGIEIVDSEAHYSVSYGGSSDCTDAKLSMHFMHQAINQLVDEIVARKMVFMRHPFLYR